MTFIECDVRDESSVRTAISQTYETFAQLDVLVNNVGRGVQGTIADNDDDEWHRALDLNVISIARVTRSALPFLRASEHAAIVNTCSSAAVVGLRNRALYSATKGAVLALTLAMAADFLVDSIRVNCVNPGTVDTPWIQELLSAADDPERELRRLVARQPIGRLVRPEEVANAIAYLASPFSASTTGTVLNVDGGLQTLRISL
jgi:NAD(P)-dependent dehydrogenase (short-subunit alcohol dehydrogenase family)